MVDWNKEVKLSDLFGRKKRDDDVRAEDVQGEVEIEAQLERAAAAAPPATPPAPAPASEPEVPAAAAPDEATVQEHAKRGGFPANRISAVRRMIDPTTAE